MIGFEYKVTKVASVMSKANRVVHLNRMGTDRWQLVAVVHGKGFREFYWKRSVILVEGSAP